MSFKIDTVAARHGLPPRRDPYWQRIRIGFYLGYRKQNAGSTGTWLARSRDSNGGTRHWYPLGTFEDVPAHQRFDQALAAAQKLLSQQSPSPAPQSTQVPRPTILNVCEQYVAHVRIAKGDHAADELAARFARWIVPDPIADTPIDELTGEQARAWRKRVRDKPVKPKYLPQHPRSLDTVNRDIAPLRAALNQALEDGLVTSDRAWRQALCSYKNVAQRRNLYLDLSQRLQLIEHGSGDIAVFLQGLAMLPMRPGAVAHLKVGNHEPRLSTLNVGKDKAGANRWLPLPAAVNDFLIRVAANRPAGEPLFVRECGLPWTKDAWKKLIKRAVVKAGLPEQTVLYTLRHSAITDMVCAGADLLTVAKISGTSVAMIEKHYGHLRDHVATAALSSLLPPSSDKNKIGEPKP